MILQALQHRSIRLADDKEELTTGNTKMEKNKSTQQTKYNAMHGYIWREVRGADVVGFILLAKHRKNWYKTVHDKLQPNCFNQISNFILILIGNKILFQIQSSGAVFREPAEVLHQ